MVLPRRRRRADACMAHQQALAEQLLPLRQVSRAPARVHRSLERSLISLLSHLAVFTLTCRSCHPPSRDQRAGDPIGHELHPARDGGELHPVGGRGVHL